MAKRMLFIWKIDNKTTTSKSKCTLFREKEVPNDIGYALVVRKNSQSKSANALTQFESIQVHLGNRLGKISLFYI